MELLLALVLAGFWGILAGRWLARMFQPKRDKELYAERLEQECLTRLAQMGKKSSPAVYASMKSLGSSVTR